MPPIVKSKSAATAAAPKDDSASKYDSALENYSAPEYDSALENDSAPEYDSALNSNSAPNMTPPSTMTPRLKMTRGIRGLTDSLYLSIC